MLFPLANIFGIESWMVIAFVGLLLFGRRLPEVGRSLGKGIIEFKKGLQGIEEDIDLAGQPRQPGAADTQFARRLPAATSTTPAPGPQTAQSMLAAGYKFDPQTGKPLRLDPVTGQPMKFDPMTGKPLDEEAHAEPAGTQPGGPTV